ncbi:MAG: precorrin-6y C5,15-methyltransferase (decarboxylating) subunit CbiE, partial [Rikenellaceae bacterium]
MRFYVIGIDDNSNQNFTDEVEAIIERSRVFSGGVRHHQIVADLLPQCCEWIDITPPMDSLFERYTSHDEIVVFASGDPLFFGFAQTIQRRIPTAEVITFPHFNSLQQLAHRLTLPYQQMHAVSLTGRDWDRFDSALIGGEPMIGVLTDNRNHTPQKIAQRMVDYGYTNYSISVGELLGNAAHERVFRALSVEEVAGREFNYPNNMILEQKHSKKRHFGIPDSEFTLLDGREKMITKRAIRLMSLSMLDLHNAHTLWDIGFCTGSVSIEAKLQFAHLAVQAFEIREGCDEIIECNMRKFGAPGIKYIIGDFCQTDIRELPPPDAVFIGGHVN